MATFINQLSQGIQTMTYNELSDEAKSTLKGMVEFCINQGYSMGMDEGIIQHKEDDKPEIKHPFRKELEAFCTTPN